MTKTRCIPYWTTSVFFSTVTDLTLIYESATSSTATALSDDCLTNDSLNSLHGSLYSLTRIHGKCLLLARIHGNCLLIPLRWKARSVLRRFPRIHISIERVLASHCLAMDYSGFQASCHNIIISMYLRVKYTK
jgi:hypothetical protein